MRPRFLVFLVFMLIFLVSGCSRTTSSQSFLRGDVDFTFIRRVAVLPFANHSEDKFANERARDVAMTQVLALGLFDAVDKGLVDSTLHEEAIEPGAALDANTLKRLGNRLNVQAFLLGSVDRAGEKRSGSSSAPELALTLRLVDAKAGIVLWQVSGQRSGDTAWKRLFGLPPEDAFQVTLNLTRDLLDTLPAK